MDHHPDSEEADAQAEDQAAQADLVAREDGLAVDLCAAVKCVRSVPKK